MVQHKDTKQEKEGCGLGAAGTCLAASLLMFMCSTTAILYIYIVELKTMFHYTQTQAEIHSASHMIGKLFILPFAALYARLRFYGTCLVGFLVLGGGTLLMALATWIPETFTKISPVIFIVQFMIANGRAYLYFLILLNAMETFQKRHTEKVVSFLTAMPGVGQMSFTFLYTNRFADISKTTPYFLLAFALVAVSVVIYVIVYSIGRRRKDNEKELLVIAGGDPIVSGESNGYSMDTKPAVFESQNSTDKTSSDSADPVSMKDMLLTCKFHLFVWTVTLICSTNYVFYVNVGLYLQSMGKDDIKSMVVATMMGVMIVSRVMSGVVYDVLQLDSRKILLILMSSLTNVFGFVILLLWMDNNVGIYVSSALMCMTLGVSFPCTVSFSKQIFGLKSTAAVQSILMSSVGIFTCVFSIITGVLYDRSADANSSGQDHVCFGKHCYILAYQIWTLLALVAPVFLIALLYKYKHQ